MAVVENVVLAMVERFGMLKESRTGHARWRESKDNQPTLKQDIADLWEEGLPPQVEQVSSHGDRVEVRRLWASEELVCYSDWPHLAQVCRSERVVHQQGKTRRELAYAVTSLQPEQADPARLLELWRGHWGVQNRVFWVRDVTVDEDRRRVRTGHAHQNLAVI